MKKQCIHLCKATHRAKEALSFNEYTIFKHEFQLHIDDMKNIYLSLIQE